MSTTTTNYQFIKPALTDPADITALNANWDKIDHELANRDSSSKAVSTVLLYNGWTMGNDGRYYQTVAVEGVTKDTEIVIVDCDLTTNDADARIEILSAWEYPSANEVDQGDGTLTFYAYTIPPVSIPIFVGVA
jgi:hypothetical protein